MEGARSEARVFVQDADMAARAAWLHFVGGLTQSEVAKRLGVPTTRAHRYIARAQSEGLVRIFVDMQDRDCSALESALMARYGLTQCRVAMEVPENGPLPLRALSVVGADWLMRAVSSGEHRVIGIGYGRTLAAAVDALPRIDGGGVRFVSILGGLTQSGAAHPYDVIHSLAKKTGAEAYFLPAPLFANEAGDKRVMLDQVGIASTLRMVEDASLVVVGIGDLAVTDPSLAAMTTMALESRAEIRALRAAGVHAEILGQFLDAEGRIVPTRYDARVMAPSLESLRGREVVAIAGGAAKTTAVAAALKSGLLTGLIVDEATARRLVERDGMP
ncbi:MAG: sugar-binding transcriptional regulator [Pseudomonadota bacterium]